MSSSTMPCEQASHRGAMRIQSLPAIFKSVGPVSCSDVFERLAFVQACRLGAVRIRSLLAILESAGTGLPR